MMSMLVAENFPGVLVAEIFPGDQTA